MGKDREEARDRQGQRVRETDRGRRGGAMVVVNQKCAVHPCPRGELTSAASATVTLDAGRPQHTAPLPPATLLRPRRRRPRPADTVAPPGGEETNSDSRPLALLRERSPEVVPRFETLSPEGDPANTLIPLVSVLPAVGPLESSQRNTGEQIRCLTTPKERSDEGLRALGLEASVPAM